MTNSEHIRVIDQVRAGQLFGNAAQTQEERANQNI